MKTAFCATIGLLVALACVTCVTVDKPLAPPAPVVLPPAVPTPPGPPSPPRVEWTATPPVVVPAHDGLVAVKGRLSATPARARDDARKRLEQVVVDRLAKDGVPRSWHAPSRLVDRLVVRTEEQAVRKDLHIQGIEEYEVLHTATLHADLSDGRLEPMFDAYGRGLLRRRLGLLGGGLAFVLACLAALAGYIRADEATKGYYTNRLRLLAAGGVGAAGYVLSRMLI
ncbi:MAG TPA: hypothetical protein VG406_15555 [Isosphaeraceae bacterium]|jgi:hypothetical protein|nr:hypothetical protein [Isosphaeraceae bacterium]